MRASARGKKGGCSALSILGALLSAPAGFLSGLVLGVVAPVGALAGIVGGVYLFTKKVACVGQVMTDKASGERSVTLKLMTPDEARTALEVHKAEFKEMWDRLSASLAEVTGQAGEKSPPPEQADNDSQPRA
ncbi:MAG: hypothetical protein JSV36_14295 [Anaerolineae bacterium]|nr:MAG: hypothetical protein JSV36_14295 [Anaerolineae bacterium]